MKYNRQMKRIIIAGYPKSGNTWLTRLVAQLCNAPASGFLDAQNEIVNDIVCEGYHRNSEIEIVKTHHWHDTLPKTDPDAKVIYIVRDPRQILLSANRYFAKAPYHTIQKCHPLERACCAFVNRDLAAWYACMVHGSFEPTNWFRKSWQNHIEDYLEDSAVLVVRYEKLRMQGERELREIANFLELDISDTSISKCNNDQSFGMKKEEFLSRGDTAKADFLKTGSIDSWKNELPFILQIMLKVRFRKSMNKISSR